MNRKNSVPARLLAVCAAAALLSGCTAAPSVSQTESGTSGTVATVPTSTAVTTTTTAAPIPTVPDSGEDGHWNNQLYIWNHAAFEMFYGGETGAREYAETVSSVKQYVPQVTVYNMVVPNHSAFGLPERILREEGCSSQREITQTVYASYTADIRAVDIFDVLDRHKDEYLYFNTDTHWAPLGAYYAYTKFCEVAGVPVRDIADMETSVSDDEFYGYLYYLTEDPALDGHANRIDLYEPPVNYTAYLAADSVNFSEVNGVNSPYIGVGYGIFAWGDQPCMKVVNHDGSSGRRVCIVKDSYGNAMVPFLVSSFDETHVIDFRHFTGNLADYCREQGITDLLFFNNVMSAYSQPEKLAALFD